MRTATANILCATGLSLIAASALFIASSYDLSGRREWKHCEQQRSVHLGGGYARSPRCLELENRFKIGAVMAASGLVLVLVARPGSRRRKAARSQGH